MKLKKKISLPKKPVLKYSVVFLEIINLLFILLILVALIPNKWIDRNINKSIDYYTRNTGMQKTSTLLNQTQIIHYYADTVVLNIIDHLDHKKPIRSILLAKHYEEKKLDSNYNYIKAVEDNKEANAQYLRYWHGSILLLKPLLIFFRIEIIYLLNEFLLYLLAISLFILLCIRDKKISFAYLISLLMTNFLVVPYCFEYSSTFYIMFIASIITLYLKEDKHFYLLLFVSSILTAFFDFLTTEILTLLMPLLLYMYFHKEKFDLKKGILFIIKAYLIWGIGYSLTFVYKWFISAILLRENVIPYIKKDCY